MSLQRFKWHPKGMMPFDKNESYDDVLDRGNNEFWVFEREIEKHIKNRVEHETGAFTKNFDALSNLVEKITFTSTIDGMRVTAEGCHSTDVDTAYALENVLNKVTTKRKEIYDKYNEQMKAK